MIRWKKDCTKEITVVATKLSSLTQLLIVDIGVVRHGAKAAGVRKGGPGAILFEFDTSANVDRCLAVSKHGHWARN